MKVVIAIVAAIIGGSTVAEATSLPACAASLQGRVTDRDGAPIAGARLSIEGDPSSLERTKPWTEPDGTFYLIDYWTKCPSPEGLTVIVTATGYLPKSETRRLAKDGWFHFDHVLDRAPR